MCTELQMKTAIIIIKIYVIKVTNDKLFFINIENVSYTSFNNDFHLGYVFSLIYIK